tara:strand:- start:680 stop:982 length:303 start_codon:yes stop_codon:yes gene_type:complete
MIQTINEWDFRNAFKSTSQYKDAFSYEGLKALYDYLEDYEDSTGEQIELDVIGLCCEYSEYDSLKDFQEDYSEDYESIEDIEGETQVIMIDDTSFIIQQF